MCWVLSSLIPKFKALTGSKSSDQTLRYLQSKFMMESPIRMMVNLDSVAIDTKRLCLFSHPRLYERGVGFEAIFGEQD